MHYKDWTALLPGDDVTIETGETHLDGKVVGYGIHIARSDHGVSAALPKVTIESRTDGARHEFIASAEAEVTINERGSPGDLTEGFTHFSLDPLFEYGSGQKALGLAWVLGERADEALGEGDVVTYAAASSLVDRIRARHYEDIEHRERKGEIRPSHRQGVRYWQGLRHSALGAAGAHESTLNALADKGDDRALDARRAMRGLPREV